MGRRPTPTILALALGLTAAGLARAGEFDRLEGDVLAKIPGAEGVAKRDRLGLREVDALPNVLAGERSTFVVVKTGAGNFARILLTPALRKPSGGEGEPFPVVILERFDTFEPGRSGARVATGRGVVLFDRMPIDLDSGQVVPEGQGGDLALDLRADPGLTPLGGAAIFTLSKPLPKPPAASTGPTPGKAVVPGDFAGRYRLRADGRWSGRLDLRVGDDRRITGRFRSDANGTVYDVTGQVPLDAPNKAVFTVKFPRAVQDYDAYLWTEGKSALSGTFTMGDRTFGFHADREPPDADR